MGGGVPIIIRSDEEKRKQLICPQIVSCSDLVGVTVKSRTGKSWRV